MKTKKTTSRSLGSLFLTCSFLSIFVFSLNAQNPFKKGKVLGNVRVGSNEYSTILDESTGCIFRTSIHKTGLYVVNEQVKIQDNAATERTEIIKLSSKSFEKVYINTSDCFSIEREQVRDKKSYVAPVSPFPYCQKNSNPIGGGTGYNDIFNAASADIYIASFTSVVNFKNTIENAPTGSIIFIDGNLVINLTNLHALTGDNSITIPAGVTLASNRGNGNGALIYTNDFDFYNTIAHKGQPLFVAGGNNVRITGIRFQGPYQYQGTNDPTSSIRFKSCVEVANGRGGFEADNCVFYGWPYTAVRIGRGYGSGSFQNNRVHHCYFYNNKQKGLGYGVMVDWGYVSIYANTFEANRHDIAGSGKVGSGYEASCNTVRTGSTSHNFDMHAEAKNDGSANAGRFIYIHHNDFLDVGASRYQSGNDHNIYMRGRPDVQCRIENNRFAHDGPQAAIKQSNAHGGYGNMLIWNNIYDTDDYLGWYVKHQWLKTQASNFVNLPSSNDALMRAPSQGSNYSYNYTFGDYDGDGNTDVYKLENGTLYKIPLDASTYGLSAQWQPILSTGYPMSSLRFGFYNNDHRTDIIRQGGNTIYVSWGANSNWSTLLSTGYPLASLKSGDFDGNGVTDLMLVTGSLWRVSYNSNSSWQTINSSGYLSHQLKLGWFNGNNRSDVFLANGTNFRVSYEGVSSWATTASSGYHTQNLLVADFNGDNISDIIHPTIRQVSLSANTTWKFCKTGNFPISSFTYGNF